MILRVSLTGNIGAGKSTLGRLLAAEGCLLIDADRLGHALLEPGTDAHDEIVAAFGRGILDAHGAIDRAALGTVVFDDQEARARLESILHPRIREMEDQSVVAWGARRGIAVTEAALVVETGAVARYHRLVVVHAPRATRLKRLVARGMDRHDAQRRMAAQMASRKKEAVADYLVDNGGSYDATRKQALDLMAWLEQDLTLLGQGARLVNRRR